MNQKKAKRLRRQCIGLPKMIQRILLESPTMTMRNRKTGEIKTVWRSHIDHVMAPDNHYRIAKKLYTGSVPAAVKAAMRHATTMEAIGVYKFK